MQDKCSANTNCYEPAVQSCAYVQVQRRRGVPACSVRLAASGSALTLAKPLTASEVVLALTVAEQDAEDVDDELVLLL